MAGWSSQTSLDRVGVIGTGTARSPHQTVARHSPGSIWARGGPEQGAQQLVVYSDYNNGNHGDGSNAIIEANVFQEQTIGAADVGNVWSFDFDAKRGNIADATTAVAFFKTLDPANGFALTNFITLDMTTVPDAWGNYSLSIFIDPGLEGQILQFGFLTWASRYEGSGIFYDNIGFDREPLAVSLDIKPGGCPNPLNTKARGLVPAAVLGSADLDVNNIDVSSLRLEGLAPFLSAYQDVAEPFAGELPGGSCGCTSAGPDGLLDLTLKFDSQDLIDAIKQSGDFTLTLTGTLLDGTPIEGQDCVFLNGIAGGASFEVEGSVDTGSMDFQLGSKADTKPAVTTSTEDAPEIRRNRRLIKQRDQ